MREGTTMLYACLALAVVVGLVSFATADAGAAEPADKPVVVIDTTSGPITIELEQAKAPITVENFLGYVDAGFYDGLIFHRVIDGFMIQGGGMDERMNEKRTKAAIKNEAANKLSNRRGTIAMARQTSPNTATSQFFINLVDNSRSLDPGGASIAGYCVFGQVIDGMDVVDQIAKVATGNKGGHSDVPLQPIVIKSAKRKAK